MTTWLSWHCKGRIVYRKEVTALSYTVADLMPQTRQLVLEMSEVETMDGAGSGRIARVCFLALRRAAAL